MWFVAAVLSACNSHPLAPSALSVTPDSALTASDQAVDVTNASGLWSGSFSVTPDERRPNAPEVFMLRARGSGAYADYSLDISRRGTTLPAGVYPLQASGGNVAVFISHRRGDQIYRYAAHGGALQVTASTSGNVAGAFQFSGTLAAVCTAAPNEREGDSRLSCDSVPARGPLLELSGTFTAVPAG